MNPLDHSKWFDWAAGRYISGHFGDDPSTYDRLVKDAEQAYANWSWALSEDEVGSPIEAILLAFALFATDGYHRVSYNMFPGQHPPPEFGTEFQVQAQIDRYRVDFLFICHYGGHSRRLIVECDGHDFHERTKEQAARDKSRDRALVKDGATVLRYTGSELYRDPVKCIEEIEVILSDLMDDALAAAGAIAGRRK
jgi:very-short-patch-repair endonuclease